MITMAIEPRFLEYCGRHGVSLRSYRYITEQIAVLSLLVPLFAGLTAMACPPAIRAFLPKFVGATPVIHVTLIGFAALSYTYPLKSMIILRRLQWPCVAILASGVVLCLGLILGAIFLVGKPGAAEAVNAKGLVAVACCSVTAYLVVSIAQMQYVLKDGLAVHKGGAMWFHAEVFGLLQCAPSSCGD